MSDNCERSVEELKEQLRKSAKHLKNNESYTVAENGDFFDICDSKVEDGSCLCARTVTITRLRAMAKGDRGE